MKLSTIFKNEYTIALIAAVLFIPYLGQVHLFDWDEINFAENAREMLVTGKFFSVQMNYERFTEKPPLFFWLQALSMKIWGINETGARFPNAVAGIITLVMLFRIGKSLFDEEFGRIWVMIYLGTFFTFLYFKSGIIDPWFNLFIFSAIYQFFLLHKSQYSFSSALLCGLFLGLAILTKGPVALLICLLCFLVMLIRYWGSQIISAKTFFIISITCFITCFIWFGLDLIQHGTTFMQEFIQRQIAIFSTSDADHGEPFFYHWWVLLLGCFPASIFFIDGLRFTPENSAGLLFKKWMTTLFWVTLILFSLVTTKIIHYSSLCWYPLTFIAACSIYQFWYKQRTGLPVLLKSLLILIGAFISLFLIAIPFVMNVKDQWKGKLEDTFAQANLEANVSWHPWQSLAGVLLLIALLFFIFLKNKNQSIPFLFFSVTITTYFLTLFIFPSVEAISQRANIDFFSSHAKEDCFLETLGYKSYAPYFYGKVSPPDEKLDSLLHSIKAGGSNQPDTLSSYQKEVFYKNWLLTGDIPKPVYFSIKITEQAIYDTVPQLEKLYAKNGFVFYKRMPSLHK
ncbi:MAG: glycosyltransferase family 39 protein [Chitinophagia bacterium]|jgi:4-amino-4-deoxy-L-arabinose transferase-like glycosyltransferase